MNFKIANGSNIPCGDYPLLEGIFTKKEDPRYIRGMYFSWTSENAEGYEYLVGDDFFDEPDEDDIKEYYDSCDGGWEEITYEEYLENC